MTKLLVIALLWWGANEPVGPIQFADEVRAQGKIGERLARACDRLNSPPLNDPAFVLSDVSFDLQRRFTEYSGDISGRMLAALDDAAPLLDRKPDLIPLLLAGFAKYQKSDGHFGVDQQLDQEVNQKRDMPILWGNGRLLFALARYCKDHNDPAVLDAARKLGDYLCSTRPYYGRQENFTAVGGAYSSGFTTCYPSVVDGLVALAEVAGNRKYADEARFIAKLSLLDDALDKHHSHGRLTTYRGMLDLDRLTATRDFIDKVRGYCVKITADYQLPTGGITELFDRHDRRDEGCSVADWLWVQLLLWRATGESACLDAAEHTLQNHLLPAQFPNGGFGHRYLRTLKEAGKTWYGAGFEPRGTEAYWCCAMHGTQALAEAARYAVLTQGDTVLITWLAEVDAHLKLADRELYVATRHPNPFTWQVCVRSSAPTDVRFRIRVPGWARTISDGTRSQSAPDGWMEMTRHVPGQLDFTIYFPDEVRLAGAYGPQPEPAEPVRVFAGADLYCLPDVYVGHGLLEPDEVPSILLASAAKPVAGTIPVVIEGRNNRRQQSRLVPLADRPLGGCRLLFKARRVGDAAFQSAYTSAAGSPMPGKPLTFTFSCDGEFELYLNGQKFASGAGSGADQLHEAYTDRSENVLTVRVRSKAQRPGLIGLIRAGDQLYVTDAAHWTAASAPTTLPAEWMADPKRDLPDPGRLDDLGPWGVDPWKHMAAQYAGTAAHWVWPADYKSPAWYAVRYLFNVP